MLDIPVIRWGKPYESIEKQPVVHFETGETLAVISQANAGMIKLDARKQAQGPRTAPQVHDRPAVRDVREGG